MTNHPNRSKHAARFVVYSLASHTALCSGDSVDTALSSAGGSYFGDDRSLCVVFRTASRDALHRFDGGRLPADAAIVWRGENDLSRRYRNH